ncbi:hypothetical protein R3Q06_30380 [Rhodococcus erythropolis]|uniref:hypothetical protein n=1 Tax=Rhodococcus erythropolis TaxID=1833 RepID=UPI002948DC47|nr:hypothetical protein [Rhodococcus erythropolis]MDV6277804.1 hypothetical protein [Rhodococcus erythropolis]
MIRSHLDALRTGSTESAAATVCAEKQVSTTTTGKVLPATTLDAVAYVTRQVSTATATVRGHLDDAPETSIGKVVSLTSTSGPGSSADLRRFGKRRIGTRELG